jgi:hypothetical protein
MTTILTFDETVAVRPGLVNDLGGGNFLDDPIYPPDPTTMPNAEMWNQATKLVAAYGKVIACAVLSIRFSAGAPSVTFAVGPGAAVVTGLFTVEDVGVGDVIVKWLTGKLPPLTVEPQPVLNTQAALGNWGITAYSLSAALGFERVQVKTHTNGVATDHNFTLTLI